MEQWYIVRNGQNVGPLTGDQLRAMAASGDLQAWDQVWKTGMTQWVQAGTVHGLFAAPQPPPMKPHVPVYPVQAPAAPYGQGYAVPAYIPGGYPQQQLPQ